jgi:hypothetical protein
MFALHRQLPFVIACAVSLSAGCDGTVNPPPGNNSAPMVQPPPVVAPPVVAPGVAQPAAANLPAGWEAFRDPKGQYSINTPGTPVLDNLAPPGVNVGPLPEGAPSIYRGTGNELSFRLVFMERNPSEVPTLREMYYQGQFTGHEAFGTEQSRQELTWGGQPAVEFVYESSDNFTTVLRVLNVGNRFYTHWIGGKQGRPTAAERAAFFDSFRL